MMMLFMLLFGAFVQIVTALHAGIPPSFRQEVADITHV